MESILGDRIEFYVDDLYAMEEELKKSTASSKILWVGECWIWALDKRAERERSSI